MKVSVFTGTRAEYGLLRPVIKKLDDDAGVELSIIVSGSHLSARHGMTVREIETDGFACLEKVELALEDDSPSGVCKSAGLALEATGAILDRMRPDMLVLLGDRYEAMACAVAATLVNIPVGHIHGGEVTEGAVDDFFRHSITKMSHLHFTSTEKYRQRVIQLGEMPERVFNVGALGVENAKSIRLLNTDELARDLNFNFGNHCLLCTYHPETLVQKRNDHAAQFFLGLAQYLHKDPARRIIITGANADSGGCMIDQLSSELAAKYPGRVHMQASLGVVRYFSAMRACRAVVGNSSSGIIEAPSFGVPTVNYGDRQKGRVRAECVFQCVANASALVATIEKALSPEGVAVANNCSNPYYGVNTSTNIVEAIKAYDSGVQKSFHDLTPLSKENNLI
ncbi:MAG: UDP-N-acetylglucosamine 2-epimerase [Desulfovibrio sp.]|jgi:UDP-hydrolysing UDP-N-acetyl-D-glucosamine 2-epimerase